MSTRRAVRPDGQVYRQTRRLGRRKRSVAVNSAIVLGIVIVLAIIIYWWMHRQG